MNVSHIANTGGGKSKGSNINQLLFLRILGEGFFWCEC